MRDNHLIDFKKFNFQNIEKLKDQIVELKHLEEKSVPLDFCTDLMQMTYNDKHPLVVVHIKDVVENNENDLDIIHYNILNTFTNMNITVDFNFDGCSKDIILFFVRNFFTKNRSIKYIMSVVEIVSDCILFKLNPKIKKDYFLPLDSIEFISKELCTYLEEVIIYLNSIPLFMMSNTGGFIESKSEVEDASILTIDEVNDVKKQIFEKSGIEVVNDIDILPKNIICLFYNSMFLKNFYGNAFEKEVKVKYYFQQFNGYIYNGLNLFYYFANDYNIIFHILNSLNDEGKNLDLFKLLDLVYKKD